MLDPVGLDDAAAEPEMRLTSNNENFGRLSDVCLGPIADMVRLFDQLVSALLQKQWHVQPKLLRRLKVDGHHEFRR